jgi:hypothetical protein
LANAAVAVTIGNLQVRNPPTTATPSGVIEVYTETADGYKVDYGVTLSGVKAVWTNITQASVTAGNYTTNTLSVTYTITVIPTGYLLSTSI